MDHWECHTGLLDCRQNFLKPYCIFFSHQVPVAIFGFDPDTKERVRTMFCNFINDWRFDVFVPFLEFGCIFLLARFVLLDKH